jgi:hypothetical protein
MGSRSASVPANRNAIAELLKSMTLLADVNIQTFAKGTVRSISFCLIRTMAASPLSRPFGSAQQQLS